ncbi:LIM domain-containing protein ajuba isoform X2 [Brienomyrus brachyistius]|uniref:LIM domain-containing protein ajuba isoform X2 n=1 Tax=Brienomyrus brachyistius TaxID=42636 RepID=UPI0020B1E62D|nr:LIM domain-containing protein ajuba isoform X2 [Brienomyrus brachyistius]
MDRFSSKLLEKLKRNDTGSVKFSISKKKGDSGNANNNNSANVPVGAGVPIPSATCPGPSPGHGLGQPALPSPASADLCGQGARGGGQGPHIQRVSPTTVLPESTWNSEHHPNTSAATKLRRRPPQQSSQRNAVVPGDARAPDVGRCSLRNSFSGLSEQLRRDLILTEADAVPSAQGSGVMRPLGQRRYSLELQQLVQRHQLLSQPPPRSPLSYKGPGSALLGYGMAELGFPLEQDRYKRLSLQETFTCKRHSTGGGEPWERPSSLSQAANRAAEQGAAGCFPGLALSPCSSVSLQESLLASPRSSFASTASGGSPMGSRCSSNRTSGISLGFDTRCSAMQFPSLPPGSTAFASPGHMAGARPHAPSVYLDGAAAGVAQDSRHSYPPASGSANTDPGEQRPVQGVSRDRLRYSDLLGTQYQEELLCLLRKEAGLPRETQADAQRLLELLEELTLKDQLPPAGPPNPSEDLGPGRDAAESRQEYFGTCVKCGKGVYGADNACQALDSLYHTRCFTCVSCGRTLRNKDFYNVSGSVYCKEDYMFSGFQAAAEKCSVCGHLILEKILQALGNSYHPSCFRCVVCTKALDGVPFTVDYLNNVYCVSDYNRTFAPKCAACLQPILPAEGSEEILRVVSMQKDYHFECYHCEDCGKQLSDQPGSQCYPLDSHLLCHSCHMTRVCTAHNLPLHSTP